MEVAYSHAHNQRLLKQRNLLLIAVVALSSLAGVLLLIGVSRDREVVLQPVLRSPLTVSSAGVSREYLELITRDVVVLTLDRSPSNLEYWMESVLAIASPRAYGKLKAELLKIVDEQRGSSIAQFFTIQKMAQSAPSCDFGQVGERFGNVAFGIDDGNHRRGQFAPS